MNPPFTIETIEELERLLAKRTPGGLYPAALPEGHGAVLARTSTERVDGVAPHSVVCHLPPTEHTAIDAALIARGLNALPELLAMARRLLEREPTELVETWEGVLWIAVAFDEGMLWPVVTGRSREECAHALALQQLDQDDELGTRDPATVDLRIGSDFALLQARVRLAAFLDGEAQEAAPPPSTLGLDDDSRHRVFALEQHLAGATAQLREHRRREAALTAAVRGTDPARSPDFHVESMAKRLEEACAERDAAKAELAALRASNAHGSTR